jgi:chromosome segregation ATPase
LFFTDEIVRREQARKEELKSLKEDAKVNEETEEQQEKRLEHLKEERDKRKAAEKARKMQLDELKRSREESMLKEKEQIEEMNRISAERKQLEAEERAREAEIMGLEQAAAAAAAAAASGQKSVGDAKKESDAIAQRIAALEALQLERRAKSDAEDAHKRALLQAESERAGALCSRVNTGTSASALICLQVSKRARRSFRAKCRSFSSKQRRIPKMQMQPVRKQFSRSSSLYLCKRSEANWQRPKARRSKSLKRFAPRRKRASLSARDWTRSCGSCGRLEMKLTAGPLSR